MNSKNQSDILLRVFVSGSERTESSSPAVASPDDPPKAAVYHVLAELRGLSSKCDRGLLHDLHSKLISILKKFDKRDL
jgi:hypothetical protein